MIDFFYKEKNLIISLDVIELFCILINFVKNKYYTNEDTKKQFNMFIEEINQKMLEHGFGYQFENELLIRIDTKFTHCQIVKPALKFLIDKKFKNANDEYIKAHEAYKNNDYETVFVECNKAFESTMKIICNLNKFDYKQNDVSSRLISILREKGFIKNYNDVHDINNKILICADTVVLHNSKVLFKPKSYQEAFEMIESYSNTKVEVVTGVYLKYQSEIHSFYDVSYVEFPYIDREIIDSYLSENDFLKISGGLDIDTINKYFDYNIIGSYSNIIGLPMEKISKILADME